MDHFGLEGLEVRDCRRMELKHAERRGKLRCEIMRCLDLCSARLEGPDRVGAGEEEGEEAEGEDGVA